MIVTKRFFNFLVALLVITATLAFPVNSYGSSKKSNDFTNEEVKALYEKAKKENQTQIRVKNETIENTKTYTIHLEKVCGRTRTESKIERRLSENSVVFKSYPTSNEKIFTQTTVTTTRIYTKGKNTYKKIVRVVKKYTYKLIIAPPKNERVSIEKLVPKVPSSLKKLFNELGCTAYIIKDLRSQYMTEAYFDNKKGILMIEDAKLPSSYHEFGHFVMVIYKIFHVKEFENVYNAEKANYKPFFDQKTRKNKRYNAAWITSCSDEFFAEAFKEYFLDCELLKTTMPKSYKLVEDAIKFCKNLDSVKKQNFVTLFNR